MSFWQPILDGLVTGSTYALVGLGFSLIFGALRVLNMAHLDVYMIGAFAGYFVVETISHNFLLAILGGLVGGFLLGVAIQKAFLQWLPQDSIAAPFIGTIGLGMFLQNAATLLFGPQQRFFPALVGSTYYQVWQLQISGVQIIILATMIVLALAMTAFLGWTWTGKAILATSENAEVAGTLGVNVPLVIVLTMGVGSALAGASGVLVGMLYGAVLPFMGYSVSLKVLAVIIVGGLGNLPGAVAAGLLLGVVESMTTAFGISSYREAVAFGLMFFFLLFRPQGLMGERIRAR